MWRFAPAWRDSVALRKLPAASFSISFNQIFALRAKIWLNGSFICLAAAGESSQ
jgi:hypothetical protein